MIFDLSPRISLEQIDALVASLQERGLQVHQNGQTSLLVLGDVGELDEPPNVDSMRPCTYPLVGREFKDERIVVQVGDVRIGSGELVLIAGPCSVESEEQIHTTAASIAKAGAKILRGGAFKPRTSPYDFQGLAEEGLRLLSEAGKAYGLVTVSEVMDIANIDRVASYVDILQVGSRNMQNFSLLKELGRTNRPILLKRGASATCHDLLMAAEYLLSGGNEQVILCERGIRTFETITRNTLDLSAIPILQTLSRLPVIVDPSHGTGRRQLVAPMAKAAAAAGADGVMIEVHPRPDEALSDAAQTIDLNAFSTLARDLLNSH